MANSLNLNPLLDETSNIANVSYNGFRFPLARHAKVTFSPETSDDGRTTKYIRMDLEIEFVWVPLELDTDAHLTDYGYNAAATTDATFTNLRARLSEQGQKLRFWSQGVGNISVQDGDNYDVNNGPKPKVVSADPIAGSKAVRVVWQCSTWFPNCNNQSYSRIGIAQLVWGISWGIGTNGLTSMTINGTAEIPLSRSPNSLVTRDSADKLREDIASFFESPLGFERSFNFTLSEDRKTLNFTITFTEIGSENPFFEGIVHQQVTRRYSSSLRDGFIKWAGSVSGSIEVAPGYSKYRAWIAFATIFDNIFGKRDRGHISLATVTSANQNSNETQPTTNAKKSSGIITSISIDEELYGRSMNFSIGYWLFCSFRELFSATGLFEPLDIPENCASWSLWRTSLKDIQGPRGWRGYQFDPSADVIVDLCHPLTRPGKGPDNKPVPEREKTDSIKGKKKAKPEEPYAPPAETSYLHYEPHIQAVVTTGAYHSIPLKQETPYQENVKANKAGETESTFTPKIISGTSLPQVTTHAIRPDVFRFIFSGRAVRAGYPVPVPNLQSVGGAKAIKIGTDLIVPKILGVGTDAYTGRKVTLHGLYWEKEYVLESAPKNGSIVTDGDKQIYG